MIDILMPGDKSKQPMQTAVLLMYNRHINNIDKPKCALVIGRQTVMQNKCNPPNPLGRHPFNIITEEIYD